MLNLGFFLRYYVNGAAGPHQQQATFDFVYRIVRLVAFDNVASTLLLVWTGL